MVDSSSISVTETYPQNAVVTLHVIPQNQSCVRPIDLYLISKFPLRKPNASPHGNEPSFRGTFVATASAFGLIYKDMCLVLT